MGTGRTACLCNSLSISKSRRPVRFRRERSSALHSLRSGLRGLIRSQRVKSGSVLGAMGVSATEGKDLKNAYGKLLMHSVSGLIPPKMTLGHG